MMKGFRQFVSIILGAVAPEELQSAKCDFKRKPKSECFDVHLGDSGDKRVIPIILS